MAYKLLGEMVDNPAGVDLGKATLVHVVAGGAATELILDGVAGVRRIKIPANSSIDVVKDAADTINCPNSSCTPIAFHW